jgi:hypothetical protein
MNDIHLTVVYTVNDGAAFKSELDRIRSLSYPSEGKPFAITAWSRDHEISRLEFIEQALDIDDVQLARDIIGMVDIGECKTLEDVRRLSAK